MLPKLINFMLVGLGFMLLSHNTEHARFRQDYLLTKF